MDNPISPCLAYNGLICRAHYAMFADPLVRCYQAWSIRAGFYGNSVFDRHLINKSFGRANIDHFSLQTSAGEIVFNIYDALDLFATIGASNYAFQTSGRSLGAPDPNILIEAYSKTTPSYSIGLRYNIIEFANIVMGFETQIFRFKAPLTKFQEGLVATYPHDAQGIYCEWQYGLGFGYRLMALYPYLGIKFSKVRVNFDDFRITDDIILNRFSQSKHIGYALGISLLDCDKFYFTLEGIYGDEKALYYGAQLRF